MKIVLLLCMSLGVIGLIICVVNLYKIDKKQKRLKEVSKFRYMLSDMAHNYNIRHVGQITIDEVGKVYEWFSDKHTLDELLNSSRPLTLEEWYTKEELERIQS